MHVYYIYIYIIYKRTTLERATLKRTTLKRTTFKGTTLEIHNVYNQYTIYIICKVLAPKPLITFRMVRNSQLAPNMAKIQ